MKYWIVTFVLVLSQMSFAARNKAERELTRERAKEMLEHKDASVKDKGLGNYARIAAKMSGNEAHSLSIKKALLQGDADLLMAVYRAIAKEDTVLLKFIGEAAEGVKTAREASALAKIAEMTYSGNFKIELINAIKNEKKSLAEAIKAASFKIGKFGDKEITLEKILECLV